jgi:2,3-bisphosphoglycerate-independent phosphoglycerate mutase
MIATAPAAAGAAAPTIAVRPVVLVILDGFGAREPAPDNAISNARMPQWRRLLATSAHGSIDASELHVGLPDGQMGNSEVGHLNLGAGRVVQQDLVRIAERIETGQFFNTDAFRAACAHCASTSSGVAQWNAVV